MAAGSSDDGLDGEWTMEDEHAATVARLSYATDGGEFKNLGIPYDPKDGFAAYLALPNPQGPYYLGFRGSQTAINNWWNNVNAGFRSSPPVNTSRPLALAKDVWIATNKNVVFVGHSLGVWLGGCCRLCNGGRAQLPLTPRD
jgi:hypothetical protein